jgi:tetratricopeptide (TPR) repeat protein
MPKPEKLLDKVKKLNKEKQYDDVIRILSADVLEAEASAPLYAEKAQAYFRLDQYDSCFEMTEKALQIDDNNARAHHYRGNVYTRRKEYEKAVAAYEKAIALDPTFSYTYNGLGVVYKELLREQEAITFFEKAIQLDPTASYPQNGLGNLYQDLGDYHQAIASYNKAISIDPDYPSPYNGLGNTYKLLEQYDKAIAFYEKAIELDPEYEGAYYNLGLLFEHLKQYDKALSNYAKCIQVSKNENNYYTRITKAKIEDLTKLRDSTDLDKVSDLVKKISDILLYKGSCVTHYTSLAVVKVLILGRSSFRISEGAFLNDTSEGRELFKFLDFERTSVPINDTIAQPFTQRPFIGSFVAENKHDNLTLWRMYGKQDKEEARGCALTVEREQFLKAIKEEITKGSAVDAGNSLDEEFNFFRVAYRSQNEDAFIVPELIEPKLQDLNELMIELKTTLVTFYNKHPSTEEKQDVQQWLNSIAYLFKTAEYQYEHEIRLVVKGAGFKKVVDNVLERVYINLVTTNPLISQITLGPKVERAEEVAAMFYYELDAENFHPNILISRLPFK